MYIEHNMSCNRCDKIEASTVPCPFKGVWRSADYRPRCLTQADLVQYVQDDKSIMSSYEIRMYLQKNADMIMKRDMDRSISAAAPCAPCMRPKDQVGTMLPEKYVVRCDKTSCTRTHGDPNGLGDGRMY